MKLHDPLRLVLLEPKGLLVSGFHNPTGAPLPLANRTALLREHRAIRAKVLARPGGFDGARAVLIGWERSQNYLYLQTQYRSYSEGLMLRKHVEANTRFLADVLLTNPQPVPELSWCTTLATYVLLPGDRVLAGKRSAHLQTAPNVRTCSITEIIEPSDVSGDMSPVLDRLVQEELPELAGLGRHYFVGLGIRTESGAWYLLAVLDLRESGAAADAVVARLKPDNETQSRHTYSLLEDPVAADEPRDLIIPQVIAGHRPTSALGMTTPEDDEALIDELMRIRFSSERRRRLR